MDHSPWTGPLIPSECPPAPKVPLVRFLRAPASGYVEGVCCADKVFGIWLHFLSGKSVPCALDRRRCPCCLNQLSRRWYGFLVVMQQPQHQFRILELTESAYRDAPTIRAKDGMLRGYVVRLSRPVGNKRGRVSALISHNPVQYSVPSGPEIQLLLARIWGIDPQTVASLPGDDVRPGAKVSAGDPMDN